MAQPPPHGIRFSSDEWIAIKRAAKRLGITPHALVRAGALAVAGDVPAVHAVARDLLRTVDEWIRTLPED